MSISLFLVSLVGIRLDERPHISPHLTTDGTYGRRPSHKDAGKLAVFSCIDLKTCLSFADFTIIESTRMFTCQYKSSLRATLSQVPIPTVKMAALASRRQTTCLQRPHQRVGWV